jgi:hypothetical protein
LAGKKRKYIGRTVAGQLTVAGLVPGGCCAFLAAALKRMALRRGWCARRDRFEVFILQRGVLSVINRTVMCDP